MSDELKGYAVQAQLLARDDFHYAGLCAACGDWDAVNMWRGFAARASEMAREKLFRLIDMGARS
jgi:hypothetical protein